MVIDRKMRMVLEKRLFALLLLILFYPSLTHGSEAEKFILDNGIVVILKERPTAPVVSLQAWVKAGSTTEVEYLGSGISHFVEHMFFKGTQRRSGGQIAQEVASCGGVIHGYTSHNRTVYTITLPSQHFDAGLDLLADSLMNPSFASEELEKEREVILREISMNNDQPANVLNRLFWETAFQEHPYRHPVIGYQSQFVKLTREDLINYHRRMYVPGNILLIAAGDLKKEEALLKIEEAFKDFKRSPLPPIYIPPEPKQLGERKRIKPFDVSLTHLRMGFHIPPIESEDVYPLDVLAVILGQGRSSRLYRRIKEEKGLVYSIDAWSYTPKYEGIFGIDATLETKYLEEAQAAILEELKRLKREYVEDEELEKAKRTITSHEIFRQETIEGEAKTLALNEFVTGNIHFSEFYISQISRVTKEDLLRVTNTYFTRSNLITVALIPEREERKKPSISIQSQPLEIIRKAFDNGLTLLLRKDPTLPIVCIRVVFKGGVRVEDKRNNGISNFTRRMLLKGTTSRTEEEIAQTIEAVGGSIETYGGNNSFGVTINLLKDELELGLMILKDILLNSNFPQEAIEKDRKFILAQIKAIDDDPFRATERQLKEMLFTLHPYKWPEIGHKESIEAITRDELLEFYYTYCRPDNMVLSIFGDIEIEETTQKIKELFDEFKPKPFPESLIPKEPPMKEIRHTFINRKKEQTIVMIGFHGIDVKAPERHTFEVITSILSGQDGRLFKSLREENPLSYSVGTYSILGLDRGAYIFYIGTDPKLKDEAIEGLLNEIKRLRDEEVMDEELQRAKRQLIGNRAISLQSNSSFSLYVSLDELYGLGYDNFKEYENRINKITKEDIRRVANTYFNPNGYALVTLGPEE
ncbi:TPA: hypothetical protein DCX15_05120 [bacterium]|nr:hypothetical protein [bacterium]